MLWRVCDGPLVAQIPVYRSPAPAQIVATRPDDENAVLLAGVEVEAASHRLCSRALEAQVVKVHAAFMT